MTASLDYPGVDIPPGHCGTCGRPGHAFCDVPEGGVGGVEKAVRLVQLAMSDAEVIARTGVAEPVLAAIRATPVPPKTYQVPRRRPARAPAAVQRRSPSEQSAFDAAQVALDEGGTPDAAEHAYWLTDELRRLRVREDARRIHAEQSAGPAPSFDAGSLAEILARPAEPPFRVERLIPAQASTLRVAQRKVTGSRSSVQAL